MGYNDSKEWLDDHADVVSSLVEIARTSGVSVLEFTSSREALRYQFFIRNVLHGIAIHYPQIADVQQAVHVWNDKNYDAGLFKVFIGTENNYTYQRTGKSHINRRLPPPTIQGRKPVNPRAVAGSRVPSTIATMPEVLTDEVFTIKDLISPHNWDSLRVITNAMLTADEGKAALVRFSNIKLEKDVMQPIIDNIPRDYPNYTLEDVGELDGLVVSLTLRRLSEEQTDA